MDLESLYHLPKGSPPTFSKDEELPSLPLPKLEGSLEKYYECLKPFGNNDELKNSAKLINDFKNGIGKELQKLLEEKANTEKNWVDAWWEKYAYMMTRTPLIPFNSMCQPLLLSAANVEESEEYYLKGVARAIEYGLKLWDLTRKEKLKPATLPDGTVFASNLWKRFFNTARVPGEMFDEVVCHFKTETEGHCPSHYIIIGNGRIFLLETINPDGTFVTAPQVYPILQQIQNTIDFGKKNPPVPILTCDDRTTWAKNRTHLMEISKNNKDIIRLIEESCIMICLDDNKPSDLTEVSLKTMTGNFHSKWVDKSSVSVMFRNGKFGSIGEHSCYDGTISVSYDFYMQLSFLENPEPDWSKNKYVSELKELTFDYDNHILSEITKMEKLSEERQNSVIVCWNEFQKFGKELLKKNKVHPDAFVQMVLQLVYYKMHKKFPPTYETAMMRFYYKGRTETVRSCTEDANNWVLAMQCPKKSNEQKINLLIKAINKHNILMKEARDGKGFDRHLFGLWCIGFENGFETHPLFTDPLFTRSGGNGNFILSTSILGYTVNQGFVAPMVKDGYGVFYSITENEILTIVTAYRDSVKTSAHKFVQIFSDTLVEVVELLESRNKAKL